MIRYLSQSEKRASEALYREAFPEDKDAFVKYYYSYVIKDNKILVLEKDGEIASMLHLNPYHLSVNGTAEAAYYYVAVATRKDCRHQGMMRALLYRSLNDIHGEEHPFTYLMPANRAIYEPFGFRIVYEQKKVELPVNPEAANRKMAELFDVYTIRADWYVEKMLEEKRVCEGAPPFEIVPYIMTRITHVERMLSLLRSKKPVKIVLNVKDEVISGNQGRFLWKISKDESICTRFSEEEHAGAEISVDIAELTEFVFGKRKIKGLEEIDVLSKICINEAV